MNKRSALWTFLMATIYLVAALGAPALVFHYTHSVGWMTMTGIVPWLVGAYALWLGIPWIGLTRKNQPTGDLEPLPFILGILLVPASVGWALVITVVALS